MHKLPILLALFCLLVLSYQQTLKPIIPQTQTTLSGEASTKLEPIVVQVLNAASEGVQGVDVKFSSASEGRTKVFCVPAKITTNQTGFAECKPLLGFSPGSGSMQATLDIPQSTQKLVYKFDVKPAKFVEGWIQISIILAGSVVTILGAVALAIWIAVCFCLSAWKREKYSLAFLNNISIFTIGTKKWKFRDA